MIRITKGKMVVTGKDAEAVCELAKRTHIPVSWLLTYFVVRIVLEEEKNDK